MIEVTRSRTMDRDARTALMTRINDLGCCPLDAHAVHLATCVLTERSVLPQGFFLTFSTYSP
jgi:hypothetical protein